MKEQLGTHFRKKRIWLKMTQEQVAKECNISIRWYRKIEKNEHFPGSSTLHAICKVLRIKPKTIRQLYIQSLKSESRLFRIADMYFRAGDQQNARKVMSRYFTVIRQKKMSNHYQLTGICLILKYDFLSAKVNNRMIKYIVEQADSLKEKDWLFIIKAVITGELPENRSTNQF
ncbi:helix-turn-helix domain-containing protein [Aneurinibacillus aneurinilyticus]|uniref:helix-turn-helix domain-containing protein n=1 Tax=Aneurinibacillus aneurinilyticus TaxID=1391 RepID=UPI0023F2B4DE|nr:helix-turn-helix transcriptional regulator [Aneurinibacillus aneurinilyticus]